MFLMAKQKPEYILEILSQFKIADYLSAMGIEPTKKDVGKRSFYHCPLPGHDDSTPSFCVYHENYDKYKCFGCSEQGDIINLICQIEGLSLKQSVSRLAKKVGIDESTAIERLASDASSPLVDDLADIVLRLNLSCLKTFQNIYFESKYVEQIDKAFEKIDEVMRSMDEKTLSDIFQFMNEEAFPVVVSRYQADQDGS